MKTSLFIAVLSCCLISCNTTYKAITYLNKITTPPTTRSTVTTSNGYAPSNVGDKDITIKQTNSSIPEMSAYFVSDNTTGPMSRAMAKYTKTGNNTAKIEHWDRYGKFTLYKLQFTSPYGGKIVGKNMIFNIQ